MIVSTSRAAGLVLLLSLSLFVSPAFSSDPPETLADVDSVLASNGELDGKVVLVDFWASWCVPCRISFPWMKSLAERYGEQGFVVVAVNVDKDHNSAVEFLKQSDPPFTIIYDSTGSLAEKYGLEAMPTSFVYGRDGKLRSQHQGFHGEDTSKFETQIAELLRKEAKK
ncbi:TlpA family protein disulfide reductase [bacterium]|nr:TlpA family protein disulfide reductase [bacterium]